jgi:prevent-host-death family protein
MVVSVTEAKNRLTDLLTRVEAGESVTIERHGIPVAQITRIVRRRKPRFGTLKKKIKILDPRWDSPQEDEDAWLAGDI